MTGVELPKGTVTFLFTDLEGSTRLWDEHPGAMAPALARHDALLRQVIEGHDGHVVKATGDGVFAVFANAALAVGAAGAAQTVLHQEQWGPIGPLKVRMGLHTSEAEMREGDYFGSAVNRTSRLMSTAHGGQVLLSAATCALGREAAPHVVDLGEIALRDLSLPEHVFQLRVPGLPDRVPTVPRSGHLPRQSPQAAQLVRRPKR